MESKRQTITVSGIASWDNDDIKQALRNMANSTKADYERIINRQCITDEQAEDLATD